MIDPNIQRLTEWLSTPPEERIPKTQKELAKELGVHETQLSIWKKELNLQSAKPSEVTVFLDSIYKHAVEGKNAMYARLWWDITHPKDEAKGAEFTADDYINAGNKLIEQYREVGGSCPMCNRP